MTGDPRVPALREAVAAMGPPVDAREARSRRLLLDGLARLPRPLDEDADPTHVTASALVVGPRGVLLHRHKRLGMWLQPGGHVDPGEEPAVAALRETAEETGLPAEHAGGVAALRHVDVHDGGRGHVHLDLRYHLTADGDPDPPEGESRHVRWFGWDEAIGVADPGLRAALLSLRP